MRAAGVLGGSALTQELLRLARKIESLGGCSHAPSHSSSPGSRSSSSESSSVASEVCEEEKSSAMGRVEEEE